jgi:hypothetical protein
MRVMPRSTPVVMAIMVSAAMGQEDATAKGEQGQQGNQQGDST